MVDEVGAWAGLEETVENVERVNRESRIIAPPPSPCEPSSEKDRARRNSFLPWGKRLAEQRRREAAERRKRERAAMIELGLAPARKRGRRIPPSSPSPHSEVGGATRSAGTMILPM